MAVEPFGGKSEAELFAIFAVNRARSFLSKIDEMLTVDWEYRNVQKQKGEDSTEQITLMFSHKENPNIRWTMDVADDKEYFDTEFESVVRKIYNDFTQNGAS